MSIKSIAPCCLSACNSCICIRNDTPYGPPCGPCLATYVDFAQVPSRESKPNSPNLGSARRRGCHNAPNAGSSSPLDFGRRFFGSPEWFVRGGLTRLALKHASKSIGGKRRHSQAIAVGFGRGVCLETESSRRGGPLLLHITSSCDCLPRPSSLLLPPTQLTT